MLLFCNIINRSIARSTTKFFGFHTSALRSNSPKLAPSKLTRNEIKHLFELQIQKKRDFSSKTTTYYLLSLTITFFGLAYIAVPLYRAICARTGFTGIPKTDRRKFTQEKLIPIDTDKTIRVSFTSQVSPLLPWEFTPQQREVHVVPGETALAFYKARNMSEKDVIGLATYSITPGEAAAYFNKIQCFCFEEQRLAAGEEVDMPVFFFIDPEFAADPRMRKIDDIILNYSFFKAKYSESELENGIMLGTSTDINDNI